MLLLTSALAMGLGFEFMVAGFWPAFFGALVVGLVSTVLSASLGESKKRGRD
jgi:putative membrane protein